MSKYVAINSEDLKTFEASVIINQDDLLIRDGKYMDLIMDEAKMRLTEKLMEAIQDRIEYRTFKIDLENAIKLTGRLTFYDGIKIPLSYVEDKESGNGGAE